MLSNHLPQSLNENFRNTSFISQNTYDDTLNELQINTNIQASQSENDIISETIGNEDVSLDKLDSLNGGKYEKLVHLTNKVPNLTTYQINNDRNVCNAYPNKDQCQTNQHCHWTHSGCHLSLSDDMAITFVNKISEELASGDLKALEILKIGSYFVSDIVDYNRFTERQGQKII
ncbi:MAG: hypothetical protein O7C56_08170, partial [Rickettsia endosymbiont of Ixodes persulcatus]|nr:hypothetical protein [Rickettsia endosymbiont of Ixodes persulcatus]